MLPFSARRVVETALAEDLALGDLTTATVVPADRECRAAVVAREALVVAGAEIAATVFWRLDPDLAVEVLVGDGDRADPGQRVLQVAGAAAAILRAERTALNLLQHLSGIATTTRAYVDALAPYPTTVCETRKTTPGLRELEKYAVRCGGGRNHRSSPADCIMIKDNHIALAGGVAAALERARAGASHVSIIEVEADTLEQVSAALAAGADVVMIDNMSPEQARAAVTLAAGDAIIEASGGITLDTVAAYAEAGVDVISVGALIHSRQWPDLGLDYVLQPPAAPGSRRS